MLILFHSSRHFFEDDLCPNILPQLSSCWQPCSHITTTGVLVNSTTDLDKKSRKSTAVEENARGISHTINAQMLRRGNNCLLLFTETLLAIGIAEGVFNSLHAIASPTLRYVIDTSEGAIDKTHDVVDCLLSTTPVLPLTRARLSYDCCRCERETCIDLFKEK